MKVRFTRQGVRVRIDDLELTALQRGEALMLETLWPGGGWTLSLDPLSDGIEGVDGHLRAGMKSLLPELAEPAREGVTLPGPPRVDVEKDFGPQHG
ncbi:hypothetical protein [Deinococcus marmoris]|uniref:hypothetical protein n=1 Tax=Deinococcus marmoris TaxID=249408 RepID=UPI000498549D|nr:hypothetical protein [Deinococcus marmoris]